MIIYISTIIAGVSLLGAVVMIVVNLWRIKKNNINVSVVEKDTLGIDKFLQYAYDEAMRFVYKFGRECALLTIHMPKKASTVVSKHSTVINLKNLVRGVGDMNGDRNISSPYLKDITEHKNNIRNKVNKTKQ